MASAAAGSIEGEVTDASSTLAVEGVEACAYKASELAGCAITDAAGGYAIANLASGSYKVEFWAADEGLNYLTQYFDGKSSFVLATPVPVTSPNITSGIDAALHPGGEVEGTVVDFIGKTGIEGIEACAREVVGFMVANCAETAASGEYTISGLPAGSYVIEFWGRNHGLNYLTQYFDGKSSPEDAEEIVVTVGSAVTGIDAELHLGGRIEGTVTDATTDAAIEEALVCANGTFEFAGCDVTDAGGEYKLAGLATDSYEVAFWAAELGYITQFYNGKTDPSQADTVAVAAPATVSGIDARLSKPPIGSPEIPILPALHLPGTVSPVAQKVLKCRKGFKKTRKLGRTVCKRTKKHHKKHRHG